MESTALGGVQCGYIRKRHLGLKNCVLACQLRDQPRDIEAHAYMPSHAPSSTRFLSCFSPILFSQSLIHAPGPTPYPLSAPESCVKVVMCPSHGFFISSSVARTCRRYKNIARDLADQQSILRVEYILAIARAWPVVSKPACSCIPYACRDC
jgi:hypothetical protein